MTPRRAFHNLKDPSSCPCGATYGSYNGQVGWVHREGRARSVQDKAPMTVEGARKELGRRIREARETAGLSREALSQGIGVPATYIHRWEKGEPGNPATRNIGISVWALNRLAYALDVSRDDLLEGIDWPREGRKK